MTEDSEKNPSFSAETGKSIQYKPPSTVEEIPYGNPLGLLDLDGTLTQHGNQLVIERFINKDQYDFGITAKRDELKALFYQWSIDSTPGADDRTPQYEEYLENVGNAFAQMYRGRTRREVIAHTQRWFDEEGYKLVKDYSYDVVNSMKEFGVRPVLITGAPFELAYWFANRLGIEHVFAMEAEVNNDVYTGWMDRNKNRGLNSNKRIARENLTLARHPIIFAMGDTTSDTPLWRGAIENYSPYNDPFDVRGKAVLINPSPEVKKNVKRNQQDWCESGSLHIIDQGDEKKWVVKQIRRIIGDALNDNNNSAILARERERITA